MKRAVWLLCLAGCGPEAEDEVQTLPDRHDCQPYTPQTDGAELHVTWGGPSDTQVLELTAPEDPAGGVYTVSVGAAGDSVPRLRVYRVDEPTVILAESSAMGADDPTQVLLSFASSPGAVYRVAADQQLSPPVEAHPVSFDLTWSYQGIMDCYEPNERLETAAFLPIGITVSAFLSWGIADEPDHDWYAVQVVERGALEIEIDDTPSGAQVVFGRLESADGTVHGLGDQPSFVSDVVEPGEYYLSVIAEGGVPLWSGQETLSEVQAPYRLRIRQIP